jgi:hypothetical protein
MSNLVRPRIAITASRINQPIRVPIYDLLLNPIAETFLTLNTTSGSATLTVKNIEGFTTNQLLILGEEGNEGTEIVNTHSVTAPVGALITLAVATPTIFPHSANTRVRVVPYDQIQLSHSATVLGVKTPLSGFVSFPAAELEYRLADTSTSGFYFAQFKNSITAALSTFSDGAPAQGYTVHSARNVIDNALSMINKVSSDVLSDEYFFNQINNCQMETLREFKRWSFMQSFSTIIGQTSTGNFHVALPLDCDDQQTTKSIYNFRIGKELDLIWVDKEDWNYIMGDFAQTTLKNPIALLDTTITLTSSADFTDAGTVMIGKNFYSYTANNRATGVLSISASGFSFTVNPANATAGDLYSNNGFVYTVAATIVAGVTLLTTSPGAPAPSGILTRVSGSGDLIITFTSVVPVVGSVHTNVVGEDATQNAFTGNPLYYTVYNGTLFHWPITNVVYNARNYYLDYYKQLIPIISDTDETVLPDPTVLHYYLAWKALLKLANGEMTPAAQSMFDQYILRREKTKQKESLNREFILIPDDGDYI